MEKEVFIGPMTYTETMNYLQESARHLIQFIGPDRLAADTQHYVFGPAVLETRLVHFSDFANNEKLVNFVREHVHYFRRYQPKPAPIFLHVFFNDDGDFDHETSHLEWDEFHRLRPYLSKHFQHIETKAIWKPKD